MDRRYSCRLSVIEDRMVFSNIGWRRYVPSVSRIYTLRTCSGSPSNTFCLPSMFFPFLDTLWDTDPSGRISEAQASLKRKESVLNTEPSSEESKRIFGKENGFTPIIWKLLWIPWNLLILITRLKSRRERLRIKPGLAIYAPLLWQERETIGI